MSERFLFFFNSLKSVLDSASVFLCCLCSVFVAFIVVLLFSLFKCGYYLKKRIWFFIICFSLVVFQYSLSFFSFESVGYALLSFSIYSLFSIPILSVKSKKTSNDAREFVKFIDNRIKNDSIKQDDLFNQQTIQPNFIEQPINPTFDTGILTDDKVDEKPIKPKKENRKDIDFTHVKNVLSRLDFYGLSQSEKKTVSELEKAILYAETEGADEQARLKINDGLGALLKIMSKYGV